MTIAVGASHPFIAAVTVIALHACQFDRGAPEQTLVQELHVAEVTLAAGQPGVARKLYQSLAERYPDDPAPRLRLAQIAFEQGDFRAARARFIEVAGIPVAERIHGEAWYGAGRAALALEDPGDAAAHFRRAHALVSEPAAAAWIVNGMAVAATIAGDLAGAEARYGEALALDPENARIVANYVRLLIEAGQVIKAAQVYTTHNPSFWSGDDEQRLRRLIREHW